MVRDDEQWLTLADQFQQAAIDGRTWYDAIAAFAAATGSEHGQLVCMASDGTMPLNLLTNVDPGLPAAFVEAGGSDPRINPRRRAGIARPPLTILAESDFITPDAMKQDQHYQEFAVPWDVPFICLTTLEQRSDLLVGLATIRTRRQGHIDDEARRIFASIAPHVRSAVRTSLALGSSNDALLANVFEALSIPAFLCNRQGMVRRLTPAAEQLLTASGLRLRHGKLTAVLPVEAAALSDSIEAAAIGPAIGGPSSRAMLIHSVQRDAVPLSLDVLSLPRSGLSFAVDSRVLVLARNAGSQARRTTLLQTIYGLTPAELETAQLLIEGRSPQDIANQRQVAVGTVRAQIKALFAKTGSSRQIDLVARLGRL
jgi:DNA-binding CsgD family transcriptional regulator/PAS domain-containing protein